MKYGIDDLGSVMAWGHLWFFVCSPLGLAAATKRATALSSAPAAEFTELQTAVLAGSFHAALFKSILSPSSSDKEMLLGKKK